MDRNEYLELCREVAIFKGKQISPIFEFPEKFTVYYKELKYYPYAYKLWFDEKGIPHHTAVLQTSNKHIIEVVLNKITKSVDKIN